MSNVHSDDEPELRAAFAAILDAAKGLAAAEQKLVDAAKHYGKLISEAKL